MSTLLARAAAGRADGRAGGWADGRMGELGGWMERADPPRHVAMSPCRHVVMSSWRHGVMASYPSSRRTGPLAMGFQGRKPATPHPHHRRAASDEAYRCALPRRNATVGAIARISAVSPCSRMTCATHPSDLGCAQPRRVVVRGRAGCSPLIQTRRDRCASYAKRPAVSTRTRVASGLPATCRKGSRSQGVTA